MFLGGRASSSTDGIAYSTSADASNSFNERLHVEADEQTLFLVPMGMFSGGRGNAPKKLSMEGGAEFFWGHFIEPLQRR
jgi:hypothetical protein